MRTRPCTFWLHFFFLNEWLILETAKFCVYVVWKCCSTQHSTMGYIYWFIETHIFIFILFINNPIFISLSCSCLSKMQKLRFDVRILANFTQLIKEKLLASEIANLVQVVKKWLLSYAVFHDFFNCHEVSLLVIYHHYFSL